MLTVSDRAVEHMKNSLKDRGFGIGICFGVGTAGCNGLAYNMEYLDDFDITVTNCKVLDIEGIVIAVDLRSIPYLIGTHIDYVTEGLNSGFKFTNPNQKASCGCGETFSV